METENFIYALRDPRTDEIRYIGFSSRGMERPNEHFLPGHYNGEKRKHYPLYKWMRKMISLGLVPRIDVLEYCATEAELPELETILVALHKEAGARLLNCTEGGDGTFGFKFTDESKAKMSAARTGMKASDEHKAAISAGLTGKKKSPEHVANMAEAQRGKVASEETRNLLSERQKEIWRNAPESRAEASRKTAAVRSVSMKEYWAGLTSEEREARRSLQPPVAMKEETKQKIRQTLSGTTQAAESLAKRSESMKAYWKTVPEGSRSSKHAEFDIVPIEEIMENIKDVVVPANTDTKISCLICGKSMSIITNSHLSKHGTTPEEYAKIPGAVMYSPRAKDNVANKPFRAAQPITKKCDLPECNNTVRFKNGKFCSNSCNSKNNHRNRGLVQPLPRPATTGAAASVIVRRPKKV